MYTFMNLGVLTGLDYYIFTYIKLKSALNKLLAMMHLYNYVILLC